MKQENSSVFNKFRRSLRTILIPVTQYQKAITSVFALICISTLGLVFIEDYSLIDGLYMTVITISTVGYTEINELSMYGRMFMMGVIMISTVTLAYAVSLISKGLIRDIFKSDIQRKRKKIKKMRDHTIVIGCGRTGMQAVDKLISYKREVVVIEKDQEVVEEFNKQFPHVVVVIGEATEEAVLMEAGINHAQSMLCTLPSDANNLFTLLTAKEINPRLSIITRSTSERSNKKLRFAGADRIIMPDKLGGDLMASLSVMPSVVEFLNQLQVDYSSAANLRELSMNELPEGMIGKTLGQLDIRKQTGCSVIGVKAVNGEYVVNPGIDEVLYSGVKIIVLGNPQQIEALTQCYHLHE